MGKKVLLINPLTEKDKGINDLILRPPLGLAYLASYLREKSNLNSYEIEILDANMMRMKNERILEKIKKSLPDIVAIHINVAFAREGVELSKLIKKELPRITVCIGGASVSSNPKEILKASDADIAIIGEGEITFLEICEGVDLKKVTGIIYKKNNKLVINEKRQLIENIDDIPFPAYDLLPDLRNYKLPTRKTPSAPIFTSRGCPYQCSFCSSSVFGKNFRAHSPEYVIKLINLLVERYGIKQLDIWDDNFTFDVKRAEKIFDLIIEKGYNLLIDLQNGIRADKLNKKLVRKMKMAGVFRVCMGIESSDREVLKKIKKSLELDDVKKAIRFFRHYKITTVGFFMFGLPYDTKKSIKNTIEFAISLNPTMANFGIFVPFPDTEIYRYMREEGLIDPDEEYIFFERKFQKNLHLTEKELTSFQKKAYLQFYLRPSKILDFLKEIKSVNEVRWFLKGLVFSMKNVFLKKL